MDPQKWCSNCRAKVEEAAYISIARVGVAALVSILFTVGVGYAQGIPGLPIPPPRPTLPDTPQGTPPVLPQKETSPSPVAPKQQDVAGSTHLSIKDIVLQGNTVFTGEQLRVATGPFVFSLKVC